MFTSAPSDYQQQTEQPWRIPVVLAVTMFIGYLDRMNISLALPLIAEEMQWTLAQKKTNGGLLMACFYMAYGVANIFLTPIAARFGPRKSLLVIIGLWSVFTSLGAVFSQILLVFIASRILLGLAEGTHVPMMNQLTKNWFAAHHRSRATGIWMGGLFVAILSGPIILVPVMHHFGWRAGFHLLAITGVIVSLPLVYFFIKDQPRQPPKEDPSKAPPAHYLKADQQSLASIIKTPVFLVALATGLINHMLAVGISNWLPSYLASRSDVDYADLTYLGALPYVFSLLGLVLWPWLGDKTNRRARNAAIGFLLAGASTLVSFNQSSLWLAMAGFTFGIFFITAFTACEHPVIQHLFPQQLVAQGSGVYNGVCMIVGGGIGTFFIGGLMVDANGHTNILPLLLAFSVAAICSLVLHRLIKY
ncbi:MAG: MFS transporter [Cellvibrionaceae bacterium]|nr:MFS transporter [Cellvibrionaceae bacterium]